MAKTVKIASAKVRDQVRRDLAARSGFHMLVTPELISKVTTPRKGTTDVSPRAQSTRRTG